MTRDYRPLGAYGTWIWPILKASGEYRVQTDHPELVKHLKERSWDKKSPWRIIGWGTSFIFCRPFAGSYEARRSLETKLRKIGVNDFEFLYRGEKCFEICVKKIKETPPMSGKRFNPYLGIAPFKKTLQKPVKPQKHR